MPRRTAILLLLICAARGPAWADPAQPALTPPPILVHYMPWFESKAISGKWGWHWTMSHFDPDEMIDQDKRSIASHYYPLIGPYDSADPDVLEYHTLLMKIAGIDGVIADWYGSEDVNDYAMIHRRTTRLFDECRKRGLKICICYEERVLQAMTAQKLVAADQIDAHARIHLQYCDDHWFRDPLYLTWQSKPVLLSFGPESLRPAQWTGLLSGLRHRPALFLLHRFHPSADGSFAWPPMWKSKDGVLDPSELNAYLDRFYRQTNARIGGAFPGFRDIYQQAAAEPSHGFLDGRKGQTFRDTLNRAGAAEFIQIITWNDFGEGTSIEPSREYEYRYLEDLQELRQQRRGNAPLYRAADLRLPLRIYRLRKSESNASASLTSTLDRAVDLLFDGETNRAIELIDGVENQLSTRSINR
jgi:hypothetical protein